ncbi:phosphotransferase family protein [Dyella solisilvae]|uniref:Phosphotransferase family protein n=1 Tax=Dyella solisilvae TaxID=1920168 RepID=A0A370KCC8_9GAMM|nr:phosphotransferase family protein [Dyella solisilvae]RDJ00303.1 phosphotransferase family protein [Dyella solisilvae]
MTAMSDQARAVREEDAFDLSRVDAFLKQHVEGLAGTPTLSQFPGGASNLTYLLSYPDRELVLRRPPKGAKAKSAHDMLREARVVAALKASYPYVPAILACCDDASVLGQDFYVMERLRGAILRRDLPPELGLDRDGVRQLCLGFLDRLVELHQVDVAQPGLRELNKGEGYIARQVAGWSERWRQAATEGSDPCEDIMAWLAASQPTRDNAHCVIHNDYRFDNVVLAPDDPLRIIGVLDWEMATVGDPLMDLGGSLAYWVQADDDKVFQSFRRQPTHEPGMLTRAEVVAYYGERTGLDVSRFGFYEVFGLFRLMVIVQQIYRRYALGQTTNPQFAGFGDAARYLGMRCRRLIAAEG